MREEIANIVHPVLARGLSLRDRLLRGEEPPFEEEQAVLLSHLLGDREARRWPEYGGDETGPFLGARYALACWLDEVMILQTPWGQRWNEHKMEVRLYASNDRAWKFWDQAKLAAGRTRPDALEAYFLCVMLGFTGDRADDPAQLADWAATTRRQLRQAAGGTWRAPPGIEPGTHVPPLRGRQALQRLLLIASAVLIATVPLVALFLARRL
ncbi:MAG: DotU family type IV/VI secretion system protein [Gemmataceae bacterium]